MSKGTPSSRTTVFGSIKRMALCAMMVAMSVVIATLCKSFLNFAQGLLRITFESLPIILTGIFLGPIAGGMVGVTSDIVGYLLSPQVFPPNPLVTLGACSLGVVSGLTAKYFVKKRGNKQIILSGILAHAVGSMCLKTVGLYSFYGVAVLIRIPLYLVIASLEITLICLLWKQSSFRRLFEKL